MKTGVTGYFDLEGTKNMFLRVHYEETYDIESAKRTVAITKVQLKAGWYPGVYYLDGSISVDDTVAVSMDSQEGTHSVNPVGENFGDVIGLLGSVSDIGSNDDGTKSITISVSVSGYTKEDSTGSGWTVSGVMTIDLTRIQRGLVYIDTGSGEEAYQLCIANGTGWDIYGPQIANGTGWDPLN